MKEINILYSMLGRDFHNSTIRRVREALNINHEIAIIEGDDRLKNSLEKVFEFADVCIGAYEYYDEYDECIPVDENLIKAMQPYEMEIMEMMRRPHNYNLDFEERTVLYLSHIRFWNTIIEKYKINHVVFTILPHEVFDYTIYCLCKVKNITTHLFYSVLGFYEVYPRAVLCRDFQNENKRFQEFCKNKVEVTDDGWLDVYNKYKGVSEKNIEDAEKNRKFCIVDPRDKYMYFADYHVRAYRERKYLKHKTRGEVNGTYYWLYSHPLLKKIHLKLMYYIIGYKSEMLRRAYKKYVKLPQEGEKYFYYTMHFQPEESSCPRGGGIFSNQWVPIQLLSGNLPEGYYLYVKEHPIQTTVGRKESFYQEISRLKNVKLIPIESDQLKLIRNAEAVATLTGTSCLESVLNGVPCISFGIALWNSMEGVFPVRNNDECNTAVNNIIQKKYTIDQEKVKEFFKYIHAFSKDVIHGGGLNNPIKNSKAIAKMIIDDVKESENIAEVLKSEEDV